MFNKKEYQQRYYQKHRNKILEEQRKIRETASYKEKRKVYYDANRDKFFKSTSKYKKKQRRLIKEEVLTYYGGGELRCIHCGFLDIRALCIDHIHGGGNKERREMGSDMLGRNIYAWLKKRGYPEGYQTLCHNCNWIKRFKNKEDSREIEL